jgi:hypothetical protein
MAGSSPVPFVGRLLRQHAEGLNPGIVARHSQGRLSIVTVAK